jgi:hypothetical protein
VHEPRVLRCRKREASDTWLSHFHCRSRLSHFHCRSRHSPPGFMFEFCT